MKHIAALALFLCLPFSINAQSSLNDFGFSGQFFFSYEHSFEESDVNSEFLLKRGYITFRRDISERVGVRFTQDVSVDKAGDGEGNIELRLKYALVHVNMNDTRLIKNSSIEFGVVSRPWIDFEQSINDYRSQRSMFLDDNNIYSSADYGVTYAGQLGDNLPEDSQTGLTSDGGRYGSFSIGIYNGGGYAALEKNNNKMLEGRLSLRPLPDQMPGFQASVLGAYGKGNIPESPDFENAGLAFSYESKKWTSIMQGFTGKGDGAGQLVNLNNKSLRLKGWSMFNEFKPFEQPVSLTLRYDELINTDLDRWHSRRFVSGISYIFSNRSKIMFDYNRAWDHLDAETHAYDIIEVVTEIRF
ncbi:MAG: hypothetical protein R6V27_01490 [Balneolaceae bacterium]